MNVKGLTSINDIPNLLKKKIASDFISETNHLNSQLSIKYLLNAEFPLVLKPTLCSSIRI